MAKEKKETIKKAVKEVRKDVIQEQLDAIKADLNTLAKEVYDPKRLEINKGK